MLEGFVSVIQSIDSGYSILALILIGVYALGWRWGGKVLDRIAEVRTISAQTNATVEANAAMAADLKALSDKVDALTETVEVLTKLPPYPSTDQGMRGDH